MDYNEKILRRIISLILEGSASDDDTEEDDGEDSKDNGRKPRGAHEYRTSTGEIVTLPDYTDVPKPKVPFRWGDDAGEAGQTAQESTVREEAARSKVVMNDMKSIGDKRVSRKYNLQQSQAGDRPDPVQRDTFKYHAGIDIVRATGDTLGVAVVAAKSGTVVKVVTGRQKDLVNGGYGNQIVIKHDDGSDGTRYGHLSSVVPTVGTPNNPTKVRAGSTIGYAGDTGRSTAPHLHFEHITAFDANNEPVGTKDPDTLLREDGVFYPLMAEIK